jgi:Ribbon-helix-helix protein, copG family
MMGSVPNSPRPGRTNRGVRIDDQDWEALGEVADELDLDRGWIIRQLIRRYLQHPVPLTERPER